MLRLAEGGGVALSPRDSEPLYLQLRAILISQISRGELKPHEKLPSERQLCQMYGMSRMTVRHAINCLGREGLVRAEPGRGVFVCEPSMNLAVRVSLAGFTEDMVHSGAVPRSQVLESRLMVADERLSRAMCCDIGEVVAKVERLRLADDVPLALQTAYLTHRLCPGILEHDLARDSITRLLAREYGVRPERAEQTVRAILAGPRERELLGLPEPSAVLGGERTTFLADGQVIEYSSGVYCGDWYTLRFGLDPAGIGV